MNITCPHCDFSKTVDPAQVPDRPVKVTCPQCKEGFSFDKTTLAPQEPDAALDFTPDPQPEPAVETIACPACGLSQPQAETCSACGVVYAKLANRRENPDVTPEAPTADRTDDRLSEIRQDAPALTAQNQPKAGFWIRVVGSVLDGILLMIVQVIIGLTIGFTAGLLGMSPDEAAFTIIINLLSMALSFSYYIFFTGYCGQTPWKMAIRVKVIRTDGSDISYGRAFLREVIGKTISGLLLCIGYIMVAFDSQKQGLHDKIADTYVIKL